MSEPLLRLERLAVRLPGKEAPAVNDVTLEVRPGETLAVVGPSGGGKSVSLRAALGLLPRGARVDGRVFWQGEDTAVWSSRRRRGLLGRSVGVVWQDPGASLNPVLTVGTHLDEVLRRLTGLRGAVLRERGDALLAAVRLDDPTAWRRRYAHQLSGGQQQRVALALALAGEPELLVADEPTTSLDPPVRGEVLALLDGLKVDRGLALIHVTHDLALIRGRADEVVVVAAGRTVESGPAAMVLAGSDQPVTRAFLDAARPAPPRAPAPAAPVVLEARGLVAGYGGATVLRGVDLRLERGRVTGLLGASGAGKTTIARVLAGFLPAASGRLVGPAADAGRGRPRPVQLVFQNPAAALDPRRSVEAEVRAAAAAAGAVDPRAAARDLLAAVGLPADACARPAHALSGGQRQHAALARTLAASPRVVVADEPAASLDPPSRLRLVALLETLCRDRGVALLLISHDPDLLRRCADRIGVLAGGIVVDEFPGDGGPTHPEARRLWTPVGEGPGIGESAETH